MQGSFAYAMGTAINPLNEEHDLDDGVYLQNLDDTFAKWEKPTTVHKWVADALKDITSDGVEDNPPCVSLIYRSKYHIDFPIYGLDGKIQYLAHKTLGWIESYPKELTHWFRDQVKNTPQVVNLVKYLKAWKDYKQASIKLPSGMILSILIAQYYVPDDEDQHAFLETCRSIHANLSKPNGFHIYRPVKPYEDLLSNYSDTRKNEFLSKLNSLIEYGDKAIASDSPVDASESWQKVFGDRFPKAKEPKRTEEAAIIGIHAKSA